jgi:hypothetical protein
LIELENEPRNNPNILYQTRYEKSFICHRNSYKTLNFRLWAFRPETSVLFVVLFRVFVGLFPACLFLKSSKCGNLIRF